MIHIKINALQIKCILSVESNPKNTEDNAIAIKCLT